MGLSAKHPYWTALEPLWTQMSDCRAGEQAIKAKGTTYLPETSGMREDGMGDGEPGHAAYLAYKTRAVFPSDVDDAIKGLVGIMHRKPPTIKVPAKLEPMLERMSAEGEDAETLLRRINALQLEHGRLGLLLDVKDDAPAGTLPYVAVYGAHSIINWATREGEDGVYETALVVLDETGVVMQPDLTWQEQEQFRVLTTDTAMHEILRREGDAPKNPTYIVAVGEGDQDLASFTEETMLKPSISAKVLSTIPFVFVNTQDLAPDPEQPPLLGLSNMCLAIYRGEADYRQTLFMQGQDTLVIIGSDAGLDPESEKSERRIGAGAIIELPGGSGHDAKYIGVTSDGLTEMREALKNDRDIAAQLGMKLLDLAEGSSQQSGDALRIRVAARTASITSIARAGAAALERLLRLAAEWVGANPDEVEVVPNVDFSAEGMTGEELVKWVDAKLKGAPISWQTIHDMLREREVTQLTFEEEQELIDEEAPTGGTNPKTGDPLGEDDEEGGPVPPGDPEEEDDDEQAPPGGT